MINLLRQVYFFRDVAQLASAPRSGRGGRPFESDHPDNKESGISNHRESLILY